MILQRRRGLGAPDWARLRAPIDFGRRCYRTKAHALHVFASWNQSTVDRHGGLAVKDEGGGFDATNERYGLRGKKRAKSLADVLWASLPPGRPFCLDRIDLETLNANQAVEHAGGFHQPDHVLEWRNRQDEERFYIERGYYEEDLTGDRRRRHRRT